MSIDYQKVELNLLYDNKIIPIMANNLEEMDEITSKILTKKELLEKLIKRTDINDHVLELLKSIDNDLPDQYLFDDEITNFEFLLSSKDKGTNKKVAIPIIYGENSLDISNIKEKLMYNNNTPAIIKTYLTNVETDDKNKYNGYELVKDLSGYKKMDYHLLDELNEKKKIQGWLENDDYNLLNELIANLECTNKIDKNMSKFLTTLNGSHYKKRTLLLIKKLYSNELSKFNESLIDGNIEYAELSIVSNISNIKK